MKMYPGIPTCISIPQRLDWACVFLRGAIGRGGRRHRKREQEKRDDVKSAASHRMSLWQRAALSRFAAGAPSISAGDYSTRAAGPRSGSSPEWE